MVEPAEQFPLPSPREAAGGPPANDGDQEPEPEPGTERHIGPQVQAENPNGAGVFVVFEPCHCKIAVENFKEAVADALGNGGGAVRVNSWHHFRILLLCCTILLLMFCRLK